MDLYRFYQLNQAGKPMEPQMFPSLASTLACGGNHKSL